MNQMRKILLMLALVVVLLSPASQAATADAPDEQEFTLQWSIDYGEVMVSTKPITSDESIYLRTSSSNLARGTPAVYSLDFEGTENWRIENPNSLSHDMSPLHFVEAGSGSCGNWPAMILVGWSDGLFQAVDAKTGDITWEYQTEFVGFGITGSMLVEGDAVIIPTRTGLDRVCLNGDIQFSQDTGIGWRNGVSFAGQSYWVGDESGNLWSVTSEASTSYFIGEGKIRHAPVPLPDNSLLIHLQTRDGSTIYQFDQALYTVEAIIESGPAPGMPIIIGDYVITTDSHQVTSLICQPQCAVVDAEEFKSNGEISMVFENIVLPRNTVEGGYGKFQLLNDGELVSNGLDNYTDDWYGTAGVASWTNNQQKFMLLVNDNANLKLFSTNFVAVQEVNAETDWATILTMLSALVLISTTAINLLRERFQSAFKYFILFCTILLYFTFSDVVQTWSDFISEEGESSDVWDDSWPDDWLGTQVVIFEFKDSTIISGGHINFENVLQLTEAAAVDQGLEMEITDTSLGKYVVSINGITGEGWEYTVNGQPGTVSAEYSVIRSDSIVAWKQL